MEGQTTIVDATGLLGEVWYPIKAVQHQDIVAIFCPEILKGEKKDTIYSDARVLEVVQGKKPVCQLVWVWKSKGLQCAMPLHLAYYTYTWPTTQWCSISCSVGRDNPLPN